MSDASVVIVGGTSGICLKLAEAYAARGRKVVITGRELARTAETAGAVGGPGMVRGLAVDLAEPETIGDRLAEIGRVDRLVVGAVDRDDNRIADYDLAAALRLVTLKLVGYAETVHALAPRFTPDASVLLYGGLALRRPYPGSTTVSTVNGGITGLVHTLAVELAPVRVNGIHPGIVGDSPHWAGKPASVLEAVVDRTPIGRLATMAELADASIFLLENGAVNGVNLDVDGGWLLC